MAVGKDSNTAKDSNTGGRSERRERRRSLVGRRWSDGLRPELYEQTREITVGPLKICDQQKKAFIHGEERQLTPKEFELLRILAINEGRVVSTGELALDLWPKKQSRDVKMVKQYVYLLRKKIEPDPLAPKWILSVKGFGYAFVASDAAP